MKPWLLAALVATVLASGGDAITLLGWSAGVDLAMQNNAVLQEDRLVASQRISAQRSTATAPSVQFAWTPTVSV